MYSKIENVEVYGIEPALRGMRNPLNSHDKSSIEADYELSRKLTKAGAEHAKHLRMIHVSFDLTAPRYFWSEFDTYKFNTKISESTMHTIHKRPLTYLDFEDGDIDYHALDELNSLIALFNEKDANKKVIRVRIKRKLPEGFLQKRTVDTTFAEMINIINQRKNHQLPIWQMICNKFLEVEGFKELTGIAHD